MDFRNLVALIFLLAGWPWLAYFGFKRGGVLWGLSIVFFSLIAGLAFCFAKKTGWIPWMLILIACLIAFTNPANLYRIPQ